MSLVTCMFTKAKYIQEKIQKGTPIKLKITLIAFSNAFIAALAV